MQKDIRDFLEERQPAQQLLVTQVTQVGNLEQVGNYCHLADMKNGLVIILL